MQGSTGTSRRGRIHPEWWKEGEGGGFKKKKPYGTPSGTDSSREGAEGVKKIFSNVKKKSEILLGCQGKGPKNMGSPDLKLRNFPAVFPVGKKNTSSKNDGGREKNHDFIYPWNFRGVVFFCQNKTT